MRAVRVDAFGGPEELRVADLPTPTPGVGEVLVRVAAAGVNLADARMRSGMYPVPPPLPFVPGFELSGRVVGVGAPVVAAHARAAYAEYALVPADMLIPLPQDADLVTAAALPVAYGVAHLALHDQGRLRPHQTVLVHAAGSGVGLAAVHLAVAAGARVIAVASTLEKLDVARAAGAELAVSYASGYPTDALRAALPDGADLLLDSVGGRVLADGLRLLRVGGRAVCFGQSSGLPVEIDLYDAVIPRQLELRGLARGALVESRDPADRGRVADAVARVLDLWGSGRLADPLVLHLPLEEAARAHEVIQDRAHVGKVLLVPEAT